MFKSVSFLSRWCLRLDIWTTSLTIFCCFIRRTWINLLGLKTDIHCDFLFLTFCCQYHQPYLLPLLNAAKEFEIPIWKRWTIIYLSPAHQYFARPVQHWCRSILRWPLQILAVQLVHELDCASPKLQLFVELLTFHVLCIVWKIVEHNHSNFEVPLKLFAHSATNGSRLLWSV